MLFNDMLDTLVTVTRANQSESVKVKSSDDVKLLHWDHDVDCFIVTPETHPQYFL